MQVENYNADLKRLNLSHVEYSRADLIDNLRYKGAK